MKQKKNINSGFSFGLTSGIITTLGLLIGLSGTENKIIIITGILTIAIADAFSDALGVHISKESEKKTTKEIWSATLMTLATKFIIACSFLIPILLFNLNTAIIISCIYGLIILSLFSYKIAKQRKEKPIHTILEHVGIAILVIIITKLISIII